MEPRSTRDRKRHPSFVTSVHIVVIAILVSTVASAPAAARGGTSYRLVFTRQPANAQVDEPIRSSAYDPAGPAVRVTVRDQNNHVVTSFEGSIALSLATNPGNGTLSGTLEASVVGGSADFPNISIDQSGFGYRLHAVACPPDCGSTLRGTIPVSPADSHRFDIVDVVETCDADPCSSGPVSEGNTTAHMETSAGSPGDVLFFSVSPGKLNCAHYRETSSLVTFDVTGPRTKTVTIAVPSSNRPLASRQVCYNSPNPFTGRNGQLVKTGLLPECAPASSDPAPCVVSRDLEGSDVIIVFSAPLGDPKGRV